MVLISLDGRAGRSRFAVGESMRSERFEISVCPLGRWMDPEAQKRERERENCKGVFGYGRWCSGHRIS